MKHKDREEIVWDFPTKVKSRERILEAWNKISGLSSVPKDRIFYTLGGRSTDSNPFSPAPWSELSFLIKRKVITPKQYYSIERDKSVFIHNQHIKVGNWIKGDFTDKLRFFCEKEKIPSIINFDSMNMARKVRDGFGEILHIVDSYEIYNVLLCCNVILQAHHIIDSPDNALATLLSGELAMWYFGNDKLKHKWKILKYHAYQGGVHTPMCNFMFYRK